MVKLTLSAQKEIVKQAKRLAKEQGTSVSALFERFVRAAAEAPRRKTRPVGRLTRRATGVMKLPKRKTSREVLEEALLEKYGF